MEDYDPPTPGYDPPTWQQKLEFQRSSFRPLDKQPYEEQLEPMDLKRFMVPFARKCCAVPYKLKIPRLKWLYARYRSKLRELKYMEDCLVERMNAGKLTLPASPLPSQPGRNPLLLPKENQYTDLGGRPPEPEGFWSTWEQRVEAARASQLEAIREVRGNPEYECPKPRKKTSLELHHEKIEAIALRQTYGRDSNGRSVNNRW